MIPPKRFDIFPLTGGRSEGLDAFGFFVNPTYDSSCIILIAVCEESDVALGWMVECTFKLCSEEFLDNCSIRLV